MIVPVTCPYCRVACDKELEKTDNQYLCTKCKKQYGLMVFTARSKRKERCGQQNQFNIRYYNLDGSEGFFQVLLNVHDLEIKSGDVLVLTFDKTGKMLSFHNSTIGIYKNFYVNPWPGIIGCSVLTILALLFIGFCVWALN